ncbi:protocadherin-like wing polarity protein stan [Trichonephila clavipes]|nr:protocadherin-like wing polarity protein stan [Trichonephila clavipes]
MAHRHVHDILQPHVLSLKVGLPGAIFLQDNDRPHSAKTSQDCLRHITTFPWPARSSDLSPIQCTWDHLGRQVGQSTSLVDLKSAELSVDDCDVGISLKYGKHLRNYLCANITAQQLEKRCSDFIQTCYRFLDLTGPLQIGGLPALQSDFQVQNQHFVGCIQDLYVDNQLVDLNRYKS